MNARELILRHAEELFNLHGYNAVGVDWIRDSAGVSKTSMYRHFGSKAKLIESVLTVRHARMAESIEQRVAQASTSREKLVALLDWHFDWFRQAHFQGCMFMHAQAEFKEAGQEIADQARHHKRWLKACIGQIMENDELRTEAVMTFVEGMIVRAEFREIQGQEMRIKALALALAGFESEVTGSR
ncbi:TetR/AcrR family transcriptional regulator [Pokkaliibacter sp. CJK22405]|uniref:TetR/AcrR family transcriptional regulator n=1 Tax=Pokkaliibacter sp. CJK22405 TaxID=3384615 RepID=UPI003984D1EC